MTEAEALQAMRDDPQTRRAAVLVTKLLFSHLPGQPVGQYTCVLALALGGILSAVPPDDRADARAGVVQQLDDAIALMTAPVEAG